MSRGEGPNYPNHYTAWNTSAIQPLLAKVLANDTKGITTDDAQRLIKALAYKAVHAIEAGSGNAEAFSPNDAAAGYTCVFTQCTQNKMMEEQLYKFYGEMWEEYLTDVVAPATAAPETNSEKLIELSRRYKHFMLVLKKVWSRQVFSYLDRFYTPKKNLPSTKLVGYQKWRKIIFAGSQSGVKDAVLDLIYRDRQGEPVDRDQLKTVIRIWVDCGLKQVTTSRATQTNQTKGLDEEPSYEMYEEDFENDFLEMTAEYYQTKSAQWTQEDSFPDYMRKAENTYNAELKRRQEFLDETTEVKLLSLIDDKLVGDHQKQLAEDPNTGFVKLLEKFNANNNFEAAQTEDLERVYRMFKRLKEDDNEGVGPLAKTCNKYITQVGRQIVRECSRQIVTDAHGQPIWNEANGKPRVVDNLKEIIMKLCNRYELYTQLMKEVFQSDPKFLKALKEAFVNIMNEPHVLAPEYTSRESDFFKAKSEGAELKLSERFADLLGSKGSDDEVLKEIDVCVSLFAHCSQKDIFVAYHMKHLAQRLLVNKSVNTDWEQQTVQWLQNHVGARMVACMAVMLTDMQAQENREALWKNHSDGQIQGGSVDGVQTGMKVLTFGKWPNYEKVPVKLHPNISNCFDQYGQWYRSTRPRTNLEPLYGLSTMEMSLWFVGNKKKICQMNVPMASILLLFENDPNHVFTVQEIYDRVGYASKDVNDDLYELTHDRDPFKHLLVHEQTNTKIRGFLPEDKIGINHRYRPGSSVKIDFVKFKAEIAENDMKAIYDEIIAKRKMTIDACLVRIAKREGTQKKQQFLARVIKELSSFFPCPAPVVSERIGRLVAGVDTAADGVLLKYDEDTGCYSYNADGN